jgi:class 3 adenylate cyclase
MAGRVYETSLERRFAASRPIVWGLVSDTNRWDRAGGLTPGRYSWREHEGQRVRVGNAEELGFAIEWIEPPYEWIEGRFVHGERRFLKGPVARGGFHARLRDAEGGGTWVTAVAYVAGDGALMPVLGPFMRMKFRAALAKYLDGLAEVMSALPAASPATANDQGSAAILARNLIASRPYDTLTQGPRSRTADTELRHRAARLTGKGLSPSLVERLTMTLSERPDEEVAQMRPFELASRWGVDRRELLRVFLHATRAGLVDLRWQINCPVCRVAAQVVGALADVTGKVHCAACNIGYGVDFGKHVEAVFQCHPSIRTVETSVFCASSPSFLPHVIAQLSVASGATRTEPVDLGAGALHLRLLSGGVTADVELDERSSLRVAIAKESLIAEAVALAKDETTPAQPVLTLQSSSPRPAVVLVERGGFDSGAVLGSVIATFPDFLDLFATEAPATGVELSIAHLALLFSDLTGSTALYERVGDARAFAIVQEHFRDMTEVVVAHRGAVVKTMGDAVMATFTSPVDAVDAAIRMVERCRERHGDLGLGAKLGVAAGPCLAVRANDRIDFFGTTVNMAARLQAKAEGGQIVVTEDLAAHPDVRTRIAAFRRAPLKATLKGIAAEQHLVAIDVPPAATAASRYNQHP